MSESMKDFRRELDFIDRQMLDLLLKRFEICKKIGIYKKKCGMLIEDKGREKQIIQDKIKKSRLSPLFVRDLFELIFKESKKLQEEIFK
jgi:chorismate mutase